MVYKIVRLSCSISLNSAHGIISIPIPLLSFSVKNVIALQLLASYHCYSTVSFKTLQLYLFIAHSSLAYYYSYTEKYKRNWF